VLVTDTGRVVLLDFGVITRLKGHAWQADRTAIAGTPAYMAPELATGGGATAASDWFSVGVMLYITLAGQHPFAGDTASWASTVPDPTPAPPSTLRANVPADLDALCLDLLHRDPASRPSGRAILDRLIASGPPGTPPVAEPPPAFAGSDDDRTFVGRRRHLETLASSLQDTQQGRCLTVCVYGRSGMGKSSLVQRFLDEAAGQHGAVVLAGRCYERESVPYKAVDSLVDSICRYLLGLPRHRAEALMPRDILMLARVFPVLRRVDAVAEARRRLSAVVDPQELRTRAFAALRELLTRLADECPVVVFIDDLQWGDLDSAPLLMALTRPPDPPPLLFVVAYRSEAVSQSPLLRRLLRSGQRWGADGIVELPVDGLEREEALELAGHLLPDARTSQELAATIAAESEGNPYFIRELVRFAKEPDGEGPVAANLTLERVIGARVARLPARSRRLLEVVATAGRPVPRRIVTHAADLDTAESRPLCSALHQAHLVSLSGGRDTDIIAPYHDRIREVVATQLSDETARRHHLALAHALQREERPDAETLAAHFRAAGDRDAAAEHTAVAARQAAEALAFDRAAVLYRRALELHALDADEAHQLKVALADALVNAGRASEAADVYLEAADGAISSEALELRRCAAEQLLRSGHLDRGRDTLRAVLAATGQKFASTPRRALMSLLVSRLKIRLRGLRFQERDESLVSDEDLRRVDVCMAASTGLAINDNIRGAEFQARALLLALRAGEPKRVARALSMEAGFLSTAGGGGRRASDALYELVQPLVDKLDDPEARAHVLVSMGIATYMRGEWRRSYQFCEQGDRILREQCTGVTWERDSAQFFALSDLGYMGEWRDIARLVPMRLREAEERGNLYAATNLRTRAAFIGSLASDEPDRAAEDLQVAKEQWSQEGVHMQHYFQLQAETAIAMYRGDDPLGAYERVVALWRPIERAFILRIQIAYIVMLNQRAGTALAAAIRHPQRRSQLLRSARRDALHLERCKMAWADPLAALVRAGAAASEADLDSAVRLLEEAEEQFDGADMSLYAALCRRRRGEIVQGEEGTSLVRAGNALMDAQAIANPTRVAAWLAPGFDGE